MSNNPNKIKYNLRNVYVAKMSQSDVGVYSYGTPVAVPGAVNLSLEAQGDNNPFYADGIVYYRAVNNIGYSGTLEMALIPDWFRKEYLQEVLDSNNVLVESADVTDQVYFALLFEFDGDKRKIRHVMYKCAVSRPSVASQTKEASITPVTETLNITCDPRDDGLVKSKTSDDTTSSVYTNWFSSVYSPVTSPTEVAKLSALSIGSLTLSPTFDADTTTYTASTTNSTNTVTATGATGTTVAITVNGSSHTSGESATWNTGDNTVVVTVTKSGATTSTYTVTVTKS